MNLPQASPPPIVAEREKKKLKSRGSVPRDVTGREAVRSRLRTDRSADRIGHQEQYLLKLERIKSALILYII